MSAASPPTLLSSLARVLDLGESAERVVAEHLRAHPELDGAGRARDARRLFAIAMLRARLDHLLGGEGSAPCRLAAYLLTEERADEGEVAALCERPRDEIRALAEGLASPPPWPAEPIARLAAERSLPPWLASLWSRELGAEADDLAAATNRPGPVTLRANAARIARDALAARLRAEGIESEPGRLAPHALCVRGAANLFGCHAWREGLFEVQDEGSQLVAALVEARPGERGVDFCAGRGGKTLALLADLLGGGSNEVGASLLALDVDGERLRALAGRARRAFGGSLDGRLATAVLSGTRDEGLSASDAGADFVLVDAPCSELGTLRRGPDRRWRVALAELDALPDQQRAILSAAAERVGPGGRLVYATCTLRRAENEEVAAVIDGRSDFEPLAMDSRWAHLRAEGAHALTLRPDRHGTDGFFIARWRRR